MLKQLLAPPSGGERSSDQQASDRLLLVAYHFPPSLTAGALRWQKLIPLLAGRGWAFDVLTLDPASLSYVDADRFHDLPSSTRVFGVPQPRSWIERIDARRPRVRRPAEDDPADRGAVTSSAVLPRAGDTPESIPPDSIRWTFDRDGARRAYGAMLVHERERAWAGSVARNAAGLVAGGGYAAVLSSGPPHGAHLGAARLARVAGIPLVTDYRDPWAARRRLPEPYASPIYFALAGRDQRRALAASSLAIATTDRIAESLRAGVHATACPVITIMNGSDDDVFRSPPRHRFIITYAGALYLDRDPRSLFRAVAQLVRRMAATPREVEVRLIGAVEQYAGRPTHQLAEEAGVGAFVHVQPTMPRAELAIRLAESSVLVSFPQDSIFAVPSKLFEYMAFEAWLLVLAGPETPSARLMMDTSAAVVAPGPGDVERIAEALGGWLSEFRAGARPGLLPQRERFSRRTQAGLLADALERFRGTGRSG